MWIPNMMGPNFGETHGLEWLAHVATGASNMGWDQAALYCIAPAILVMSQKLIIKINSQNQL